MPRIPRRLRDGLICCAVAAIALVSGGIFTFPILAPALALHLKLTQPQLTTIVLAGIVGQYPFAVAVGKLIDLYGPWLCSLASACFFSAGFGLFAWEIAKTPDDISAPSQSSFHRLTAFFFLSGLGTVCGLFSSLFAASKNFPQHLGFASGASMAMFSLSPLFLSVVASSFFTDAEAGLDVTHFLIFLAILCGLVNGVGTVLLRIPADEDAETATIASVGSSAPGPSEPGVPTPDETEPLLPKGPSVDVEVVEVLVEEPNGTLVELLRDPQFWLLCFLTFVNIGTCEMVITNIGSLVLSLPRLSPMGAGLLDRRTDAAIATQVRLTSVASTLARLLAGPLADFISPIASYLPSGERCYPRKHWVNRMAFITSATLLCAAAFVYLELFVRSQDAVWLLSVCVGTAYGVTFTILPSIMSAVWGANNVGRNFGVLTYAAFAGTPCFSYLYAFVSARHAGSSGVCRGTECWRLTFGIATGATLAACLVSGVLWRKWRGRC